jgi:hypothetical protein
MPVDLPCAQLVKITSCGFWFEMRVSGLLWIINCEETRIGSKVIKIILKSKCDDVMETWIQLPKEELNTQ